MVVFCPDYDRMRLIGWEMKLVRAFSYFFCGQLCQVARCPYRFGFFFCLFFFWYFFFFFLPSFFCFVLLGFVFFLFGVVLLWLVLFFFSLIGVKPDFCSGRRRYNVMSKYDRSYAVEPDFYKTLCRSHFMQQLLLSIRSLSRKEKNF